MKDKHDIKVVYGDIKRESVMIDPNIPVIMSGDKDSTDGSGSNIIAVGTSSRELLKQIYGR